MVVLRGHMKAQCSVGVAAVHSEPVHCTVLTRYFGGKEGWFVLRLASSVMQIDCSSLLVQSSIYFLQEFAPYGT